MTTVHGVFASRSLLLAAVCVGCAASSAAAQGIRGLVASGPARDLEAKLAVFGQFVGDWDCDVTSTSPNGTTRVDTCEWHWGWILQGRALQDVWIVHTADSTAGEYGTAVRVYDPKIDAWHCVWIGPVHDNVGMLTARRIGGEIVLQTPTDRGRLRLADAGVRSAPTVTATP